MQKTMAVRAQRNEIRRFMPCCFAVSMVNICIREGADNARPNIVAPGPIVAISTLLMALRHLAATSGTALIFTPALAPYSLLEPNLLPAYRARCIAIIHSTRTTYATNTTSLEPRRPSNHVSIIAETPSRNTRGRRAEIAAGA